MHCNMTIDCLLKFENLSSCKRVYWIQLMTNLSIITLMGDNKFQKIKDLINLRYKKRKKSFWAILVIIWLQTYLSKL